MVIQLNELIAFADATVQSLSEEELSHKINSVNWSKKEILGHLIDSAINNLKRLTEAQFDESFSVNNYRQNELVKANFYQEQNTTHLLSLFVALNNQIREIVSRLSVETLTMKVKNNQTKEMYTVEWLIQDYIKHMKHHLDQMK